MNHSFRLKNKPTSEKEETEKVGCFLHQCSPAVHQVELEPPLLSAHPPSHVLDRDRRNCSDSSQSPQAGPKGSPGSAMLQEGEHGHTETSPYHPVSLNDLEAVLAHSQQGESVSTFPSQGFKSVDGTESRKTLDR